MGELAALVLLPAAGAGLTPVLRGRVRAAVGLAVAALTALAALALARRVLDTAAAGQLAIRGPAGVEVVLVADGLAVAMVVMTAVVALAVTAFAAAEDHRDPDRRHRAYWPLTFTLWAGLDVLFLAGDLVTAYLMLELIALCGALLVTLRGDRGSLLAGTRYFYAELVASTTMLVGIAVVWAEAGTIAFAELGPALVDAPLGRVGLAVMTVGLLLKAPLAPIHFWLPAAHTLAPSAVSPILSGVMVKAAFAVVARLWALSAPELVTPAGAQLLGGLGAVAVLWGSFGALRATGLKRLVASSTVAQIGLMFLLPPLVVAGAVDGWTGGVVLAVTHAFAKAALLMAAAVLVDSARRAGVPTATAHPTATARTAATARPAATARTAATARPAATARTAAAPPPDPAEDTGVRHGQTTWPLLEGLRGSAARRPVAMMAFGVAGLSLVGLPPTGGFVAKWYLLVGSLEAGQWWWVVLLVTGTLLTAAYLMRFVRPAFAPLPEGDPGPRRDARDLIALALATSTLLVGLLPGPLLELVALHGPAGAG